MRLLGRLQLRHPNAGAILSGGLEFNNLIFSGTTGQINFCHESGNNAIDNPSVFNLLEFDGDAIIKGFTQSDTLVFVPGKSYQLEFDATQVVNEHFQVLGNNCNPIELSSTQLGASTTIKLNGASVNGDFIQMQDQIALSGQEVFAGSHSTDIGNSNVGWRFEAAPTFVGTGFLGLDRNFCQGESLELSAYNYSNNEVYEWSTGSTDPGIAVSSPGTYWAKVTFGNACEIIDTITIQEIIAAEVDLGADTSLCEGEQLNFAFAGLGDNYRWQDGNNDSTYRISSEGTYILAISSMGCISRDTLEVSLTSLPILNLGRDTFICEGESLLLDASQLDTSIGYLWQDASTLATFSASVAGRYSVEIIWPDGSNQNTYRFDQSGLYILMLDDGICFSVDTIIVEASSCGTIELYVPNAFSPNDDGVNDTFYPFFDSDYEILEFEMQIFDRWGSLVYSSTDINGKWDARTKNGLEQALAGVYIYQLRFKYMEDGEIFEQSKSGDVTLVR